MSELPLGWALAEISEICAPADNWNPRSNTSGTFSYIDIEAVDNKRQKIVAPKLLPVGEAPSRARVGVKRGDILFSLVRPYLKNISVIPEELDGQVASTAFLRVRPAHGVKSQFLFNYFLQDSFISSIPTYGNSPPSARDDEFVKLKFPLPPEKEQERIANKIDELFSDLDASVAALERARANLKRYRASVLKAAVEGRLTAEWRKNHPPAETASQLLERILTERRKKWEQAQLAKFAAAGKAPPKTWKDKYPEPAKPDTANLPELPEGWSWASVDQCSSFENYAITDGPFGSNLKSEHYTESGPRVIRLQNIGDGFFVNEYAHISEEHFASLKKHSVENGDLVIAVLGEELPRACVVPDGVAPAIVKADCVRFKPKAGLVDSDYMNYVLNSYPTRFRCSKQIKGVGRPRLNLSHIRGIAVPLPPIDEQSEIVLMVSELSEAQDRMDQQLVKSISQATLLRQSILKRAFEGKLVPQDPNDEPASVLLERIRATRADAPKAAARRGRKRAAAGG